MSDYDQNYQQPYIYRQNNASDGRVQLAQNDIQKLSNASFIKGLISAILCSTPIASIVSIFLGSAAVNQANEAFYIAEQYNFSKGKAIAGKILGKIGQIAGIVMTCIWGLYIILIFLALIA